MTVILGSVMRIRDDYILDPDFYPSRIPDPTTAPKKEGKTNFCPTIFCSHKLKKKCK